MPLTLIPYHQEPRIGQPAVQQSVSVRPLPQLTQQDSINERQMQALLQAIFRQQAVDVLRKLKPSLLTRDTETLDDDFGLEAWTDKMTDMLAPLTLRFWRQGMVLGVNGIRQALHRDGYDAAAAVNKRLSRVVLKAKKKKPKPGKKKPPPKKPVPKKPLPPPKIERHPATVEHPPTEFPRRAKPLPMPDKKPAVIGLDFDLFNPKVVDAAKDATLRFCRETNASIAEELKGDLRKVRRLIREEVAEGLSLGEGMQLMGARIQEIITDPMRAQRIAVTESNRAIHAGQVLAQKESGVVMGNRWLASSNACELCLELDGEERGLDEPFYVDPKGGPYAICLHPPRHVHCRCTITPVL